MKLRMRAAALCVAALLTAGLFPAREAARADGAGSGETLYVDDLMQGAEYDIEGFGILKIAACSFEDSLPHFDEAGHLGIGDGYVDRSGEDAEFLLLRAGIVNTAMEPRRYLPGAAVKAVSAGRYEFEGRAYQYDWNRSKDAVLHEAQNFEIGTMYEGHFLFCCMLPNAVVNADTPLRIEFTIDGLRFVYQVRRDPAYAPSRALVNGAVTAPVAYEPGDTLLLGAYEQDGDPADGKEPIEWIVLDKQETKLLLISRYALDCAPYNGELKYATWETCTLRAWLNGEFLEEAFEAEERQRIVPAAVRNPDNALWGTRGGNETVDSVFVLSIDEAYGYFASEEELLCEATPYAYARGAVKTERGYCQWWLRTPGFDELFAANVIDGYVNADGGSVRFGGNAVRPAMIADLG